MKKKYVSPQQLKEEANRFNRLVEYAYFSEADENEDPPKDQLTMDDFASAGEKGGGAQVPAPEGGAPNQVPPAPEGGDPNAGEPSDVPFSTPPDDSAAPTTEPTAEGEDATEEIDVTDIVQSAKETQAKADEISAKVDQTMEKVNGLLEKIGSLEGNVAKMDQALTKIDSIYKELELMKPPSPEEAKEIMAQNSYPFNVTLDKYKQEGTPQTQTDLEQRKNKLSLSNLLSDFNERDLRQSFNPTDPFEDKLARTLPSYRI